MNSAGITEMKLNNQILGKISNGIQKPVYQRDSLKPSIVHIGVGGFHRSHQAVYQDELLNKGLTDWSVCGMGIKPSDERMYQVMKAQDGLYTVLEKHPDGSIRARVVGSITDYIYVPVNRDLAISRLADPLTKIVSLTITEGGYNFDEKGEFDLDNPDIKWDLSEPDTPRTVFGLLVSALRKRMEANLPAFTILSCDNIQHNGDTARKMLLSFTDSFDRKLSKWIGEHVAFPNCMVDRITPVTAPQDIELLKETYELEDAWPVTCEPFIQWVLEDRFPGGRPAWEKVGVQFVKDIEPYEKMKLRLLNAGHSLLGMTGLLYGHTTIGEAVNDPQLRRLLRQFMDIEVTPVLSPVEGIDIDDYKDTLFERFSNPNINDQLTRICGESSAKLPKFLIPTVREQLEKDGPVERSVLVLAAWCGLLETYDDTASHRFDDLMLEQLRQAAVASATGNGMQFIEMKSVFGDLAESPRFARLYLDTIRGIREYGIQKLIQEILK